MKAKHQGGSFAEILFEHTEAGTYIDAKCWSSAKIKRAWGRIEDDAAPILVAIDPETEIFAFTTKALIRLNLGGLLELPADERAAAIDATFNIARSNIVLSTIGTNSVTTKPNHQFEDSILRLMKFKGACAAASSNKDPSKGQKHALSFRPMVMVWGPSESSACWEVGFSVLKALAAALFDVSGDDVFEICCADGARSGHLGYRNSFPRGKAA
jgi:hypothetical protein